MRQMHQFLLLLVLLGSAFCAKHGAEVDNNDFAEFEEFDDDEVVTETPKPAAKSAAEEQTEQQPKVVMAEHAGPHVETADDEEATVEDEDENDHLQDPDEFEGFDKERTPSRGKNQEKPPDLKITKIPLHLRTNWDSFYLEMLMLAGLGVYFLNFLAGKNKNQKLAQAWLSAHRDLLESNFSIVGDDGTTKDVQSGILMKESEHVYALWCSGRAFCEGMLVELRLLKRQDLINTISRMFKPATDQVTVKVTMDEADMDTFVMCIANKKTITKMHKEMNDLSLYCPEKKGADKLGLPASYQVLSEIAEATSAILDRQISTALNRYEGIIEYIHISDQYSGPRVQEEGQAAKMPETKKVLMFCFNVPGKGRSSTKDMESLRPLLQMVFYCLDKARRIRLSKEAKTKADRNRQKVSETYMKATHAQRQEAAQTRREEKRRAEKERILNEDDSEKQRKWEERESRREMKKKMPKMKMMKC